ncbi:hypothetical protein BJ138DRAFT_1118792 [Hygrophoropsis aurantiaca]|uniref:Uncharacterized protein n=1 Tax=Hygrophoropsis aurantiaca TaxID=72124 RepID=A0ACB7ZWG7_9AGAM|nr:hypothetical protein BJ138DRAFT_1118792 [Hygrophoropsis aurantiaca]
MPHQSIIDIVERVNDQGAFVFVERNAQSKSYLHLAPTPFVLYTTVAETADIAGGIVTIQSSFMNQVGSPFFVSIINRVISDPTLTVLYAEDHQVAKLLVETVCSAADFALVLRC